MDKDYRERIREEAGWCRGGCKKSGRLMLRSAVAR